MRLAVPGALTAALTAMLTAAVPVLGAAPAWASEPGTGDCAMDAEGTLTLSPPSISIGETATLSWDVTVPPYGCSDMDIYVSDLGEVSAHDSALVQPTVSRQYRLWVVQASVVKQLDAKSVTVTAPQPAYGRTTYHFGAGGSPDLFVQLIGTPNTTILLDDDVDLDLTGRHDLVVVRGVHIIGGRSSTKLGPRLFTTAIRTEGPQPLFSIGEYIDADGVRISGVRIDGGDMGIAGNAIIQDDDKVVPFGIVVDSSIDVEIANSEIYGWSGIGIQVKDERKRIYESNSTAVWIHDNYIHHNRRWRHEGYGVQTAPGAKALIERNVFDYNRHALESSGEEGSGYRAYHNLLLENGGENFRFKVGWTWYTQYTHQFDVHGTKSCGGKDAYCGRAGEYYDYRFNALYYTRGDVIKVRGEPTIGADVAVNNFAAGQSTAIIQTDGTHLAAWGNNFNVAKSPLTSPCDFDGDGAADGMLPTGVSWWYISAATGQYYFLATSRKKGSDIWFGDANRDGRCDVYDNDGAVYRNRPFAPNVATATLAAATARSDIVWTRPYTGWGTGGEASIWQLTPDLTGVEAERPVTLYDWAGWPVASPTARLIATADFNADGTTDLLWIAARSVSVTLLDEADGVIVPGDRVREVGSAPISRYMGVLDYGTEFAGVGDLNGDRRADILWRKASGQLVVWFAGEIANAELITYNNDIFLDENGVPHPVESPVALDWKVRGIADFNGDGFGDILWRNDDGRVWVWYMVHNMHIGDSGPTGTDPDHVWEIQGIGDFNADGKADILWRSTDGQLSMWYDGPYEAGRPKFENRTDWVAPPEWQIAAIGDFNHDGNADILWRRSDGFFHIWMMNGPTYIGGSGVIHGSTDRPVISGLVTQPVLRAALN
jgi:hypothetical protein